MCRPDTPGRRALPRGAPRGGRPSPLSPPHRPGNGRSSRTATPVDTRARVPQLMRQSEESPRDLTPLFAPASVAVVGASNDPSKYGNWLSRHALEAGDVRRGGPVSPPGQPGDRGAAPPPPAAARRRGGVGGPRAARGGGPVPGVRTPRRLPDVGGRVELVALAVPAEGFEAAVEDALAAGARAIVAVTAGFAELGPAGAARQAAVVAR